MALQVRHVIPPARNNLNPILKVNLLLRYQTRQTSTSNHAEGALIIHQRHHNEIAALTQLREGDR